MRRPNGGWKPTCSSKHRKAFANQVVANVPKPRLQAGIAMSLRMRRPGQRDRGLGNFPLRQVRVLGNLGQLGAIQVAALKIHSRISPSGIFAQDAIEKNEWF